MSNGSASSTVPSVDQYGLAANPPSTWKPQGILYKKISARFDGGYLNFKYVSGTDLITNQSIDQFIDSILPPNSVSTPVRDFRASAVSAPVRRTPTPLDFRVSVPCWIVFELDTAIKWQFRVGFNGVTTKVPLDRDYAGLWHVFDNNERSAAGPTGLPHSGCRIAYFSVVNIMDSHSPRIDPFNLNVELLQTPGTDGTQSILPLVIDPDITNQGGPH